MKVRYLALGAVAIGVLLVGSTAPASADITDNGSGCKGRGDWNSGVEVDAATKGGVYTIPRSDSVHWQGSVKSGSEGTYSGSISVDLPWPLGEALIDDWSGEYETTGNEGDHKYDLPSLVPAGVEFELHGEHSDKNGGCSGTVTLKIAGGVFDSLLAILSLVGTGIFLMLFVYLLNLFMKVA